MHENDMDRYKEVENYCHKVLNETMPKVIWRLQPGGGNNPWIVEISATYNGHKVDLWNNAGVGIPHGNVKVNGWPLTEADWGSIRTSLDRIVSLAEVDIDRITLEKT